MSAVAVKHVGHLAKGVALCALIALPCYLLGQAFEVIGGPVFAIVAGCLIAPLIKRVQLKSVPIEQLAKPGIAFTSKYILQTAVVLLGFGLNLAQILAHGYTSLPVILSTIATALVVSYALCRVLDMPRSISILVGVGSSICGGSAIAATAPVIKARDEDVAQAISVIFFFNVIAALIFPALGTMLGLTNEGFALFAGTAVNDTSSVTATAAAWDGMHPGADTLSVATIVKLTRTLAIIPITLVLSLVGARGAQAGAGASGAVGAQSADGEKTAAAASSFSLKRAFPTFVGLFVLASLATSLLPLPALFVSSAKIASKFFIVMAMAAIGLNTNVIKLIKTGAKPLFMGAACWICIALVSLLVQHLIGIM